MSRTTYGIQDLSGHMVKLMLSVSLILGLTVAMIPLTGTYAFGGTGSCGDDTYCGIKGMNLDAIYYSNGRTGLVVIYDKAKIGDITPWVSTTQYRKGMGTVDDAISYLKGDLEYAGFRVVKGKKSTGFFRSEVVDGLYVVVPTHGMTTTTRAPDFWFAAKDGGITLYIRDFKIGESDEDGM